MLLIFLTIGKFNITRGIHRSAQGTNFGCGKLPSILPNMKLQPLK
jgi:hypothetical protein